MMSNQKQFPVTHKMLTAVERAVEGGLMLSLEGCSKFALVLFCYNKSLNDWSIMDYGYTDERKV